MVSGRGHSREFLRMTIEGGVPSEIARACGVHPVTVSSWIARNRQEVEEAQKIYRDRLIDSLLYDLLTRCRQEVDGLTVADTVAQAATPPPPHITSLNENSRKGKDTGKRKDAGLAL